MTDTLPPDLQLPKGRRVLEARRTRRLRLLLVLVIADLQPIVIFEFFEWLHRRRESRCLETFLDSLNRQLVNDTQEDHNFFME